MADTGRLDWQKSTYCDSASCMEVACCDERVILRDGKDPDGPRLSFTTREWASFVAWARQCGK
jgi:hypothetical protein